MGQLKRVDSSYDSSEQSIWYLEGLLDTKRGLERIPLHSRPFRIGRHPSQDLRLDSESVSQQHAEIYQVSGLLRIRDLGSTNGTFVNRRPVTTDTVLVEGDVLHFADLEFIVARASRQEIEDLIDQTSEVKLSLPEPMIAKVRELRKLIDSATVDCLFQPIISLSDGEVLGYEMLGRAHVAGLADDAYELFNIAAMIGAEAELSRLFRIGCVESCRALPGSPTVFLNTHPAELGSPGLVESLRRLRAELPDADLVLEVHEVAITEPRMLRRLKSRLSELSIGLAYDDFGAGQSRLVDVVEVPPDYLKFDMSLIRGIDRLVSKQRVIESLVGMAIDLGVTPAAEGLETEEEMEVCRRIGFLYGQGFLLGRPRPVEELRTAAG